MPVTFQVDNLYLCNTLNMENEVHHKIRTREHLCCHDSDVSFQRIRWLFSCPLPFGFLFRECTTADGTYPLAVQSHLTVHSLMCQLVQSFSNH